MVLSDGDAHTVDSNEMAFRRASVEAFRSAMLRPEAKVDCPICFVLFCSLKIVLLKATVMEPIMLAEVTVPLEYQAKQSGCSCFRKSDFF